MSKEKEHELAAREIRRALYERYVPPPEPPVQTANGINEPLGYFTDGHLDEPQGIIDGTTGKSRSNPLKVNVKKAMENVTIEVCYVGQRRLKVRFLICRALIWLGVRITGARYVYVGTKDNDKGWWTTVSWDADIGKPRTVEIDGDFYTAQGR